MGRRWSTRKGNYILKSNLPIGVQNMTLKSESYVVCSWNCHIRDKKPNYISYSYSSIPRSYFYTPEPKMNKIITKQWFKYEQHNTIWRRIVIHIKQLANVTGIKHNYISHFSNGFISFHAFIISLTKEESSLEHITCCF